MSRAVRRRRSTKAPPKPPGEPPTKRILVSVDAAETRVAILEDDRTAECYVERRGQQSAVGHVWKGKVTNVLAGMEAAFVDVGLPKNGFLHVDEVVALGVPKHRRQIAELLQKGGDVIVQATKDAMGTKGVRLTMQLSLAGRFLVYLPYGDGVGISKRLDDDERTRLRSVCDAIRDEGDGGIIVRTAAAGAAAEELGRDLTHLRRLWSALQRRSEAGGSPTLLYTEADISLRVIRDLLNDAVEEVLVDDQVQHDRILKFLRRTSPGVAERVHLYAGSGDMMRELGVEAAIDSTLDRRAPLPSGGSLVIDDTEAMTVIDVNSGRNVGKGRNRLEDTVTRTNLEAAAEVVRQLRLRDIGGIVIIDFIDMDDAENRKAVKDALDEALRADRTRTFVGEISALGLVEMTRQNIFEGPREIMCEPCPECEGEGTVLTLDTLSVHVERQLRLALRADGGANGDEPAVVRVNPRVARRLADGGERVAALIAHAGRPVDIVPDDDVDAGDFVLGAPTSTGS